MKIPGHCILSWIFPNQKDDIITVASHERHGFAKKTSKLSITVSPQKGPAIREAFPCHDVIMKSFNFLGQEFN